MAGCLGIYVDKNLIKYAKLKRERDSFKIESFNVEVFEDLKKAIKKIINETDSQKDQISINISDEIYNYFDVYSVLEKRDITKSLDIEFEMLCEEKGYDKSAVDSRYILMENKEEPEKYKALYISASKKELDEKVKILSDYKLFSILPVSTSITNLIETNGKENVAIINIENETTITTVVDGQINRVDVLTSGMQDVIGKINKIELSWKKAYDVCKNISLYNQESKNLEENEYLDIVMPVLEKIAMESKKVFNSYKEKISKVYITGMGATISNIDLYFQDVLKNTNCEILKPFFVEPNSLKIPTKEYIEVNSAIALALDGLGYMNKELNFAPSSRFDNLEFEREKFSIKNLKKSFKEPFSAREKLITRGIAVFVMTMIVFSIFGTVIYSNNKKQIEIANEKITKTSAEIEEIEAELSKIESHTNAYTSLINSADSLSASTTNAQNNRTIPKNSIPNMLKRIMAIIPQKVQIVSIENTEDNHIVIEAVSEIYDQLGFFFAAVKADGIFENVQSTTGDKSDSLVKIVIEGDLK